MNYTTECNDPNNTSQELADGFTCACDLALTWDDANGMFDVQHYSVNISGKIINVTTTSHTVRIMPETNYLVLVSTVTKCQQTSNAAEINVRTGKLYTHG